MAPTTKGRALFAQFAQICSQANTGKGQQKRPAREIANGGGLRFREKCNRRKQARSGLPEATGRA
jgi:hypothetical protein